jgi:predicted metal-dependent phosphoesterase TrpH
MTDAALSAVAEARSGAAAPARERTGRPSERAMAFADFHIHTRYSRDSILSEEKFIRRAIERGLTHVAVTNHNNVEGAIAVREHVEKMGLSDEISVVLGEEVSSADGEIVGLFLQRTVPRGLTADETADAIHAQGGLVSIPHPFDPFRSSHIKRDPLVRLAEAGKIDMVEVFNSRVTFQRHNQEAADFAAQYEIPGIAASDSHSSFEIAMSFNALPVFDSAEELRAGLGENEWHGSRSTVLIHLTTRYAVWSNIIRRKLGIPTAAAPMLGPQPPRVLAQEPVAKPQAEELPNPHDPDATADRG